MTLLTANTFVSSEAFVRRIVAPMATMVVVAIVVVLGFVVVSAAEQNRLEISSSTKLAETALRVNQRQMARNLRDYAVWEDVYRYLHKSLDFEWASTDGNVGANIYEGLGYEMAFVVNPESATVYSVIEGVSQDADAFSHIPTGLGELIAAGRQQERTVVELLRTQDDILMVAAAPILPPSIDRASIDPAQLSTLIFVKRLDRNFLSRIGDEYLLRGLKIVEDRAVAQQSSYQPLSQQSALLPLEGPDGATLGYLTWTPDKPGYELLRLLLPPLAIALVSLAVFASVVMRNARRSAQALADSARTVESYAQTLQESEARFRDVAEASSDWIWEADPNLCLVYLSSRFSEVTGISAASFLGKSIDQFFSTEGGSTGWARIRAEMNKQSSFRDLRCSYRDADGNLRICELAGRPVLDSQNGLVGFRGTATDITEEVEAHARANHLALHDALTELPNRIKFRANLDHAFEQSSPTRPKIAILCLDLDYFKEVNDTLGHAAGDQLLVQVAERLRQCVRPRDTVARLGGDEFSIISANFEGPDDVVALSLRVIDRISEPYWIEGQEIHISVTIGAAVPDEKSDDPDKLLKSADIALYRAKNSGRGLVRFFEAKMDMELKERKALESELRQALSRGELQLNYQPIVDLKSGRVAAVEALLRWNNAEHGCVSPEVFIPLAEKCGLIGEISEWILRQVCSDAQHWPDIIVAMNVSPVHFRSRDMLSTVRAVLSETGLPPHRLELEVTESVLIKDTETALDILTQLKATGVGIAMDDFGTGYASLGYLNMFPFDKLKIDRSFISGADNRAKSDAIVKSTIFLGESLDMTVTAEGVETFKQAQFLRECGCEQAQGYYFARPMPLDGIVKFLNNWQGASLIEVEAVQS